jgi:nicotinamide-nucleotide amidase
MLYAEIPGMIELGPLLLTLPRITLAVAESMTGGQVQAKITALSGASDYFLGGITAYSLEQKVKHLGVNRAAAAAVNSVSAEVAEQMARGVCTLFGSDLAVATTGYAEPFKAASVTEPFAWWAIAYRKNGRGEFTMRHGYVECLGANRVDAQKIVAEGALTELEEFLREIRITKA